MEIDQIAELARLETNHTIHAHQFQGNNQPRISAYPIEYYMPKSRHSTGKKGASAKSSSLDQGNH